MSDGSSQGEAVNDASRQSPSSVKSAPTHRRSLSGNLFSRLNFLRSTSSDDRINQVSSSSTTPSQTIQHDSNAGSRGAMATVQGALDLRRRNPSLRKAALLGGSGRRKSLPLQRKTSVKSQHTDTQQNENADLASSTPATATATATTTTTTDTTDAVVVDDKTTDPPLRQSFSYESIDAASSPGSALSARLPELTLDTQRHIRQERQPPPPAPVLVASTSPSVDSPASQSYASTTDDDDVLSFGRTPAANAALNRQPITNSRSYYASQQPLAMELTRRRSNKQNPPQVLDGLPMDPYMLGGIPLPNEVDYSDTEWWGWVVLIVTWLAFVIGMGSCFGVWSWAWDVGQTPYAPPELEDDPTLPIVGYYPALITLTAVMAWVWVILAWVGIKYFKHAKIQGEDT